MIVEGAGVELAAMSRGQGPLVLLVHGIASDAAALAATVDALASGGLRVVVYDRRGYGRSGAPEPYDATTVEEQAEDAAAVFHAVAGGAPAILVGYDFGALICLDLLKRHRALCGGAVLAEPPLYAFVPEATEMLATKRALVEERLRARTLAAAVEAWAEGRITGADLERAKAAARAVFADLVGLTSWPVTRRELRTLDVPTVVLSGPTTGAPDLAAADVLASLLPAARRATDGDVVAATMSLR